jgi:hypothetical protein
VGAGGAVVLVGAGTKSVGGGGGSVDTGAFVAVAAATNVAVAIGEAIMLVAVPAAKAVRVLEACGATAIVTEGRTGVVAAPSNPNSVAVEAASGPPFGGDWEVATKRVVVGAEVSARVGETVGAVRGSPLTATPFSTA